MPEGDTLYRAAQRVGAALVGNELERVAGSAAPVRAASGQLTGSTVTSVVSVGKHLVIDTDAGLTIRTHLGMPGVWHVYGTDGRWRRPAGAARVVLTVTDAVAVCFSAPEVEVDKPEVVRRSIAHLGPDLTANDFDAEEAYQRLTTLSRATIAETLSDQRGMAGIGNVYKSEVLFMERVHPETSPEDVDDATLRRLVDRSRQLLMLNRSRSERITTGDPRRGHTLWVYNRQGKPCRRCRTAIESAWVGDLERITYWCPKCQPAPGADRT